MSELPKLSFIKTMFPCFTKYLVEIENESLVFKILKLERIKIYNYEKILTASLKTIIS